jgi:hypothetical protein
MKQILFVILGLLSWHLVFYLTGCTETPEEIKPIIAHVFGDRVYVTGGFYRGCKGRVTAVSRWGETNYYSVEATCISPDGQFTQTKSIEFDEKDLLEDAS